MLRVVSASTRRRIRHRTAETKGWNGSIEEGPTVMTHFFSVHGSLGLSDESLVTTNDSNVLIVDDHT